MELIATTDQQLHHLGRHKPNLGPYFAGVFASDRLPSRPLHDRPRGYIMNLNTHDQPGSHWIALWTDNEMCSVVDSFAIPLHLYEPLVLFDWLTEHFDVYEKSHHALQAVDSQAHGLYTLMFLVHMSVGGNLDTFVDLFSRHDFVKNDHRVAQWFQHLVEDDLKWYDLHNVRQSNDMPICFFEML